MPIRARDLGLPFPGTPGPLNAITDLPGVSVGFCTLTDPSRDMRTGVTAILPRDDRDQPVPVWAGFHALNGNGEMTGTHWIDDAGLFHRADLHHQHPCHRGGASWRDAVDDRALCRRVSGRPWLGDAGGGARPMTAC